MLDLLSCCHKRQSLFEFIFESSELCGAVLTNSATILYADHVASLLGRRSNTYVAALTAAVMAVDRLIAQNISHNSKIPTDE